MKTLIVSFLFLTAISSYADTRQSVTNTMLDSECTTRGHALDKDSDPNLNALVEQTNRELGITEQTGSSLGK